MTEKRFKLFTGNNYGVQSVDGEVFIDSIVSIGDADVLVDLLNDLSDEIEQLKQFQNKVFDIIDTKIKEETYSAEMIKKTLNINEDYVEPVNILTIKSLEQLKKELQND